MKDVLVMEHMRDIFFADASQGVVMMIFDSGEVYFYPINEATLLIDPSTQNAVYDEEIALKEEYKIITLPVQPSTGPTLHTPKVQLVANQKFLLVNGVYIEDVRHLVIYQIHTSSPPYFYPIFCDLSMTYLDASITADTLFLCALLRRQPGFLSIISLHNVILPSEDDVPEGNPTLINPHPRKVDRVMTIGPILQQDGSVVKMDRIVCSDLPLYPDLFERRKRTHFITWDTNTPSTFTTWHLTNLSSHREEWKYEYRTLKLPFMDRPMAPSHPITIVDISFSPKDSSKIVISGSFITSLHMSTMQVVKLSDLSTSCTHYIGETGVPARIKWTYPFVLGVSQSLAGIVPGEGTLEVLHKEVHALFQPKYTLFAEKACNFAQVGVSHRFWCTLDGQFRVLVGPRSLRTGHSGWAREENKELLEKIEKKVGYHVLSSWGSSIAFKPLMMQLRKDVGTVHNYFGLHCYRCTYCGVVLVKPLMCPSGLVVYCSIACQRKDWDQHILEVPSLG